MLVVAAQREPVPAQGDRAAEPLAERVEDAVLDTCELGRDLVRDVQHLLGAGVSVGGSSVAPARAGAASGELLLDELVDRGAVGAARDLVHDAGHDAPMSRMLVAPTSEMTSSMISSSSSSESGSGMNSSSTSSSYSSSSAWSSRPPLRNASAASRRRLRSRWSTCSSSSSESRR